MKEIKVNELTDNLFETISKEWMLVTAGTKDKFNTMTANWGGAGFLWNRPVAFIFIRPERYTFDFIEQNDYLTLSFLGEEHKEIHKICGSKSGRDMDKVKATGLSPLFTENGSITFEQARLTFECKKRLSGNFWLVSFKISYLCLPLFYETRTTPSCHPSGCAYRQL